MANARRGSELTSSISRSTVLLLIADNVPGTRLDTATSHIDDQHTG